MNTAQMTTEATTIFNAIKKLTYTQKTLASAEKLLENLNQKFPNEPDLDTSFSDVGVSSEEAAMSLLINYARVLVTKVEQGDAPDATGYAARVYKLLGYIITEEEKTLPGLNQLTG